jgi:hypothetical protein
MAIGWTGWQGRDLRMMPARESRTQSNNRGIIMIFRASRAVSQLLWPDKDREVWFSLEENHEKAYRFPDFLQRGTGREK